MKAVMDWKWFLITWRYGSIAGRRMYCVSISLDGITPEDPLTPKMARQAARAAVGQEADVWVFSNDEKGYALYPSSQREIGREDLERYKIEPYTEAETYG